MLGSQEEDDKTLWHRFACPDANRLGAYLDQNLPESEAARVKAHIAGCSSCRETVYEIRNLAHQEPFPVSPEAICRAKAIVAAPVKTDPFYQLLAWTAAAAALVLVCYLGYWLGQDMSNQEFTRAALTKSHLNLFTFAEPVPGLSGF